MRWVVHRVVPREITGASGLRLFSTGRAALAPKRAGAVKGKSHVPATHGRTALTSSPLVSAAGGRTSRDAKNGGGEGGADDREEERRLAEGDTRLAMRTLMQHHFFYQHNVRRPEEQRLGEERQALREKHRARLERIEEKSRNAMQLGPDVAVDGILPIYSRGKLAAAGAVGVVGASKPAPSWMRLNPVEAEAGVGEEGGDNLAGALLMKPDLSAYDAEHDHRIRSAEVLDEEQKRRQEELKNSDATKKLWSPEELEMGGGLTPQRVVQSQLMEDEDQDFAVEAYSSDYDE